MKISEKSFVEKHHLGEEVPEDTFFLRRKLMRLHLSESAVEATANHPVLLAL